MDIQAKVNHLPVLTWNQLKLNHVTLFAKADLQDVRPALNAKLPAGISVEENVEAVELEKRFDALAVSNPKETVVAGKLPMYNAQRFATGMGKEVDTLLENAGCKTDIYTVEADGHFDTPILLTYDYTNASGLSNIFIHAKAGSESTFIMNFTADEGEGLVGASARVYLEEGAKVHFVRVQMLPFAYTFFDDIGSISLKKSDFSVTKVSLGAGRVYEGLNECQLGDKSEFSLNFGYLGLPDSFLDMNYNDVFFGKKANGTMRFFEALLGNAEKTFRGTLDFRQNSKASVGDEQEDVLLFGEDIINKTIPLILCEEEDVDGRHAATIGRLPEDMLFYMQSRGFSEQEAKKVMVEAKLNEVIRLIPDEALRKKAEEYIASNFAV